MKSLLLLIFVNVLDVVIPQGLGSGSNGNLRLCVVEGRGSYKRAGKFCPTLDEQSSGVECVIGTDRLDCLRRMGKGTVDFGLFNPEDLIAAQWANYEVLVTSEVRNRKNKQFQRNIVALVRKNILPESKTTIQDVLRNTTLCHPGSWTKENRKLTLSDTLAEYLESLVTENICDPKLSMAENRIKSVANFFGKGCKAGPWVADPGYDQDLKLKYSELCAACKHTCDEHDPYWGDSGALVCLTDNAGDVTWADLENVQAYFGLLPKSRSYGSAEEFSYLCRDGSWQPLTGNSDPCIWLKKPWPVIVSKSKSASAVKALTETLTSDSVIVEHSWHGALASLLELNQALPESLDSSINPSDYLSRATGFTEAYSRTECSPPRHITFCTTSLIERLKCDWLSEAGAVYGVSPALQCMMRRDKRNCFKAMNKGEADIVSGDSDWLVAAKRDYSARPILFEVSPIVDQMHTVVAFVRNDAEISNMADLRGKRAYFPKYDGHAWYSVFKYLSNVNQYSCDNVINNYFSEVCALGIEKSNLAADVSLKNSRNCIQNEDDMTGEEVALRALIEGKTDVAFISMDLHKKYVYKQIPASWAQKTVEIKPICHKDNTKYCFLSWSSIGHLYSRNNLTSLRRAEIVNVFTKLDLLFGKTYPFHSAMFSMYGPFNHKADVLFHNNTKVLVTDSIFSTHPYDKIPFNFEQKLSKEKFDSCQLKSFGAKSSIPTLLLIVLNLACMNRFLRI